MRNALGPLCRRLVLGSLVLILLGAAVLRRPVMLAPGETLSWLDAAFLATSAVTGTGLVTADPARTLSPAGWIVLTALIEAGLMGVLILGTGLVETFANRYWRSSSWSALSPGALARRVALFTIGLQLAGTCAIFPFLHGDFTFITRLDLSFFHAVAAVGQCNFSPLADGLQTYRYSSLIHLVIVPLTMLGGLGYPVLRDLWGARRGDPLTPYTRLVLASAAGLYIAGVAALSASAIAPSFYEELQLGTTSNMPIAGPLTRGRVGAMVADASSLTVAARGGGLPVVPLESVGPAGRVALMALMFIGGSPGGAGGGMSCVTLGIAVAAAWSLLRRRRAAPSPAFDLAVRMAAAVALFYVTLVGAGIFLLSLFEPYPFIKVAFEVVSGAGNAGLSLGVTLILTAFSKIVLMGVMVLGRWGVLGVGVVALGKAEGGTLRVAR